MLASATQDQSVRRIDDTGAVRRVVRTGRLDGRTAEEIARTNFGVDQVDLLDGGIGYLKLSRFVPAALSRDAVRAAVDRIAHSSAVIVDLRGNIGGSPDAVAQLLSPFFAAERGNVLLARTLRLTTPDKYLATDDVLPGVPSTPRRLHTERIKAC